jgi:hypothetical protein
VIGELTVNLQAQTAEFHDSLGKANSGLQEFGEKGEAAGKAMSSSFGEARGGLMLTEHLIGVPLPRHLNSLIAQIPGVGTAFATMLPVVGVLLAVEIIGKLIEKHKHLEESAEAVANKFNKEVSDSLNKFDDELLTAGIKIDELTGDHVAKLNKELTLIDHHTLHELESEFERLGTAADKIFDQMHKGFLSILITDDAKAAFDKFKDEQAALLAAGKDTEAEALRVKYLTEAKELSAAQLKDIKSANDLGQNETEFDQQRAGILEMKNNSQKKFIELLEDEGRMKATADKTAGLDKEAKRVEDIQRQERDAVSATASGEDERLAIIRETIAAEQAAGRANGEYCKKLVNERNAIVAAGYKEALKQGEEDDKLASEMAEKQIALLKERGEEIAESLRGEEKVREAVAKAMQTQDAAAVKLIESQKKAAEIGVKSDYSAGIISKQQEQEQLKAILVKEESDRQDAYSKELSDAEQASYALIAIRAAAYATGTDDEFEKATTELAAARAKVNALMAQNNVLMVQNAAAIKAADVEQKRLSGDFGQWITDMKKDLPTTAKMFEQTWEKAMSAVNAGLAKAIVEGKNFGAAMKQMGAQLLESVIEQEMKKLEVKMMTAIKDRIFQAANNQMKVAENGVANAETQVQDDAAHAHSQLQHAKGAFAWCVDHMGTPIGEIVGAGAFAAVMAFAEGGLVPGSGDGDTVPAMLTPGETVVTKALTQQVAQSQGGGNGGGRGHVIQHSPTYNVSTMDSRGFSSMLQKHDAEFQAHAVATMRKLNIRAGRG